MSAPPDYREALERALAAVEADDRRDAIDVADARGRVLAESIAADRDLPPFDRAQMDGYAVRHADLAAGRPLPVTATIPAGAPGDVTVPAGTCVAIATGAPLPGDVDTVVPHEWTDRGDPVAITLPRPVEPGHAVHPRGADARTGAELVAAGTVLGPQHLALAATVGLERLDVRARPTAAVLTSGDEIVEPDATPQTHQVRNGNRTMVRALLDDFGAACAHAEHLPDDRHATTDGVARAIDAAAIVVTVGGISAGDRDHFLAAFEACRVEIVLRRAAVQPGGPITVGRHAGGTVVVALPGNPVSVLACAHLFLRPIVRARLGLDPDLPWRPVTLAAPVRPNSTRRAFRPARLVAPDRAEVPAWAGSGDLAHTARCDGLLELPVQPDEVPAGTVLRFLAWT